MNLPLAVRERTRSSRSAPMDEAVIGAKTYVLTYTYVMPDDRIPYSDFLYYSILGSETEVPINRFHFSADL